MKQILYILFFFPAFLFSQGGTYLKNLYDVSTTGAASGDVLQYNGKGWAPATPVNITGLSSEQILFFQGDSIAGSNNFLYDKTGDFSSETIRLTGSNQPQYSAVGTAAGWIRLGTSSNTWDFTGLTAELRIKPSTSNGTIKFRNQASTDLFTINTTTGEVKSFNWINSVSGYRLNGAATSGNYLRGDGTNFVSSAIQLADLPAGSNTNIANTNLTADGNRTLNMNGNQLAVSNAEYISLTGNDGGVSADNAQLIVYGNNTNGIYGVANTSGQDSYIQLKGTDFVVADGALDTTKSIKYLPYANYLRLGNWALQVSDALGSGDDGALMAYNDTNKRWEAALPSGGELYTTAGSSIPAGSYFAAVTGLTSDGLVNFTATDSTLTYTGTKTKDFLIQYDASVTLTTSGSGAFLSQLVIHVDDVEQARTRRQHTVNAAGAETWRYTIAGHQVITLAQNEVVKLKSNNTAGATFTASYLNLTITEKR